MQRTRFKAGAYIMRFVSKRCTHICANLHRYFILFLFFVVYTYKVLGSMHSFRAMQYRIGGINFFSVRTFLDLWRIGVASYRRVAQLYRFRFLKIDGWICAFGRSRDRSFLIFVLVLSPSANWFHDRPLVFPFRMEHLCSKPGYLRSLPSLRSLPIIIYSFFLVFDAPGFVQCIVWVLRKLDVIFFKISLFQ